MTTNTLPNLRETAYNLLKRRTCVLPALAYFEGRKLKMNCLGIANDIGLDELILYTIYPIDKFVRKQAFYLEETKEQKEEGDYAKRYPISATLDTALAVTIGLPLAPIAFLAGLVYTTKDEIEELQEKFRK